ncbi:MAG: hypothetical protein GWN84_06080, partial [Gammaproteobacteria bacterium]|nr:hypothetical protein [Gammaproteobacteria bacterium]NIR82504.1 hypothetical protein [Gammaproteobacteria bacterium]NIV50992.1 hypothetical protein [Gammaproteobacteria bacterium]
AGTWLLTDAVHRPASGPLGLGAMVISRPRGGPGPATPAYDREYALLYQDADDRWNHALDAGGT